MSTLQEVINKVESDDDLIAMSPQIIVVAEHRT